MISNKFNFDGVGHAWGGEISTRPGWEAEIAIELYREDAPHSVMVEMRVQEAEFIVENLRAAIDTAHEEREPEMDPCPFCGSVIVHMDNMSGTFNALCPGCWAKGPSAATRQRASDIWNTRIQVMKARSE